MQAQTNPFSKVDKQSVIGTLKATGSRDPDVLHASKATMLSTLRLPKLAGALVIFCGVLLSLTIIGAFLGIPMILMGWFFRRRGSHNVAMVEAGYADYLNSVSA